MHEASLVARLLRMVDEMADQSPECAVAEVCVRVGALAGVEPLLVSEAFGRLRAGTRAAKARLTIAAEPLTIKCRDCLLTRQQEQLTFVCSHCGGRRVDVLGGDLFLLDAIVLSAADPLSTTV